MRIFNVRMKNQIRKSKIRPDSYRDPKFNLVIN